MYTTVLTWIHTHAWDIVYVLGIIMGTHFTHEEN